MRGTDHAATTRRQTPWPGKWKTGFVRSTLRQNPNRLLCRKKSVNKTKNMNEEG